MIILRSQFFINDNLEGPPSPTPCGNPSTSPKYIFSYFSFLNFLVQMKYNFYPQIFSSLFSSVFLYDHKKIYFSPQIYSSFFLSKKNVYILFPPQFRLSSIKLLIKGPQIGSDMPSALFLIVVLAKPRNIL